MCSCIETYSIAPPNANTNIPWLNMYPILFTVRLEVMCLSLSAHSKVLEAEALAKMELSNPANFGPKKYFLRECMSEVEGQVPHPGLVPLPKEMTGKYRAKLAAVSDD